MNYKIKRTLIRIREGTWDRAIRFLFSGAIHSILNGYYCTSGRDTEVNRQRLASLSTSQFIEDQMSTAAALQRPFDVIHHAVSRIDKSPDGMVLEFGVASGVTINLISSLLPDHTVHGFDSFNGLPEFWRQGFPAGTFRQSELPRVNRNVKLVVGMFDETLPRFLEGRREPAILIHIDCDLYSSAATVLRNLSRFIVPGTVIVFDEFFNYPGWREGEHRAFREFIESSGLGFEYLCYCCTHEQVAVRIK